MSSICDITILSSFSNFLLKLFFFLGLVSTLYEIYSNNDWFNNRIKILENSSISYYRINCLDYINIIDLIFDIYYIIIKEKYVVFNILPLIFVSLYPIVLFYLINLIVWIFYYWFIIIKAMLFNKDICITPTRKWCSPFDPLHVLVKNYLLIIKDYGFYSIYALCFIFKKKGINIHVFEKFVILFCVGFPAWYIQCVLDLIFWIDDILKDDIWTRKKKKVWIYIFIRKLKYKLFMLNHRQASKTLFNLISLKIIIKNRKPSCNPDNIKKTLEFVIDYKVFSSKDVCKFYSTIFHKKSHQFFCMSDKYYYGWHATTSNSVEINSESFPTLNLSYLYAKQKLMFSHVPNNLIKEGISKGVWDKYELYNYENYAGLLIRLKIMTELHYTDTYISQTGDGVGDIIKFDKMYPAKEMYFNISHYRIEKNIKDAAYLYQLIKNKTSSQLAEPNETAILEEISEITNSDLYNCIKHNLYTNVSFQNFDELLKQSHRNIIEKGDYVK